MAATPRLFVVRVWRQAQAFRASVRSVDEAEPLLFTEPRQLAEFLREASDGRIDADGGLKGT